MKRHDPSPQGPSLSDRLSVWLQENHVSETIGGDLPLLKWLSRCLLTIGGRSIGHLYSYLDRHEPIMNQLVTATGDQVSHLVHVLPCSTVVELLELMLALLHANIPVVSNTADSNSMTFRTQTSDGPMHMCTWHVLCHINCIPCCLIANICCVACLGLGSMRTQCTYAETLVTANNVCTETG